MGNSTDIKYNGLFVGELAHMDYAKRQNTIDEIILSSDFKNVKRELQERKLPTQIDAKAYTTDLQEKIAEYRNKLIEGMKNAATTQAIVRLEGLIKETDTIIEMLNAIYQFDKAKSTYMLKGTIAESDAKKIFDFLINIDWLYNQVTIFPPLDSSHLEDAYVFYMPIFPQRIDGGVRTYAGDAIICYSFTDTIEQLKAQRQNLIVIIMVVTAVALGISVLGSMLPLRPFDRLRRCINMLMLFRKQKIMKSSLVLSMKNSLSPQEMK